MRLLAKIEKQPAGIILCEGLLLAALVGLIDWGTIYDIPIFVLYAIPILFTAWFAHQKAAVLVGGACVIAWAIADTLSGHDAKPATVVVANTLLQLGFFAFIILCSSALKLQLDQSRAKVDELKRFQLLAEIAPVGIFRANAQGGCVYGNQRWGNITGASHPPGGTPRWTEALHPDDKPRVEAQWKKASREGKPLHFQARFRHPEGKIVWALGHVAAEQDKHGTVTGFVGAIADMTEHRMLERQILEISEREQQRIGQDLHDDLCQFLAAIQFAASSLRSDLQRKNLPEAGEAREIADLLKESILRTRSLARTIFPVQLEKAGLISALHELAGSTSRFFNLRCSFDYTPPFHLEDPSAATHLYRITQEAINNAIKHGKAKTISISLESRGDVVTLVIDDDGIGFPKSLNAPQTGMGLRIMEYRAHTIGGTLQICSHEENPGGLGTRVSCTFRKSTSFLS